MTKNAEVKKSNSYKRISLIMLGAAIGGGVLGIILAIIMGSGRGDYIGNAADLVMAEIQQAMIPVLAVITIVSVAYGELNLRKQRMICGKVLETEDEECDQWEYAEEKNGAYGTVVNLLSQILCILILSVGYSSKYIGGGHAENMLAACGIFLACYVYDGFWQVRFVKTTQKAHPDKLGDPSSMKFQKQWLDSCDEAEKEVIYRSAYTSYIRLGKTIPVLLVVVMLGHLFFNTGIMAIVVVAVVWLVVTVSYLNSCVKLKGQKIRE